MSEMMNKHQELARTGHFDKFAKGGRVGHKDHGHSKMESGSSHPKGSGGGSSVHNVTSQKGQSTSAWDTSAIGSGGGSNRSGGGGTGGTRNRT